MRRVFAIIATLIVLVGVTVFFMMRRTEGGDISYPLNTDYDIDALASISVPDFSVSVAELRRMDHEAFRIISRAPHTEAETFALYTSLTQLERRFVALSYAVSGSARGSIVPLAHRIICKALPDDCVFLWRTLDDYRAFDDAYTIALTDAVMQSAAAITTRTVPELSLTPAVFSVEGADAEYETMHAGLTAEDRRAATLWSAGEGTRQAPGILLDLIDGYLALDTTRSIGDFAVARGNLMVHAYDAYRGTGVFAVRAGYPVVHGQEHSLPYMVVALHAMAPHLRPLLHERAQIDLDTEIQDATNAFSWSGNYYPAAVREAERIGDAFAQAGDSIDAP